MARTYDLQERLLSFAVDVAALVETFPSSRLGIHSAGQLLRSSTSPFANHAGAQGAESRRDFVHKLRLYLKELQETQAWLSFAIRTDLCGEVQARSMVMECRELLAIMATSIRTAERRG